MNRRRFLLTATMSTTAVALTACSTAGTATPAVTAGGDAGSTELLDGVSFEVHRDPG